MDYRCIDYEDEASTYRSGIGTQIEDISGEYAIVPNSIAKYQKFSEKGIPYFKVHLNDAQLLHLKFYYFGEVGAVNTESQLESIQRDIKDMQHVLTDIQCGLTRIETGQKTDREEINKLRSSTEDLPAIRSDIKALKDSLTGWKHYILSPLITGIVVGLFLLIIKLCFHIQ